MGKTKHTYEEVKAAFDARGYDLISTEYRGVTQKLEYICRKHKNKGILTIDFRHLVERNQGCKYCAKERDNPKRIQDNVIIELCCKNNFSFIKSEAENGKTMVYYICNNHKNKGIQKISISNLKNKKKNGCKYCLHLTKKTHNDFLKELFAINPDIEVLTTYITANDYISCRCKICGNEWRTTPNRLLSAKSGCKKCSDYLVSQHKTKSNDDFIKELKEHKPNIIPLDKYKGAKTKLQFKCLKCNTTFISTPDNVLQSKFGCSKCAQKYITKQQVKSHQQFLDELHAVNPNLIPLEEYKTDHEKIKMYCRVHDYTWMVAPNKIIRRNTGCPKCSLYQNEAKICNILDRWGYRYSVYKTYEDCKDKQVLPFDIHLTDFNILIEYDGEGHYLPIQRSSKQSQKDIFDNLYTTQMHDQIKTEYCNKYNIPLIRIPYWEQDNLEELLFDQLCKYNAIEEIV